MEFLAFEHAVCIVIEGGQRIVSGFAENAERVAAEKLLSGSDLAALRRIPDEQCGIGPDPRSPLRRAVTAEIEADDVLGSEEFVHAGHRLHGENHRRDRTAIGDCIEFPESFHDFLQGACERGVGLFLR